jgi:hypothetical protein
MASNMEKAFIYQLMEQEKRVSGIKESDSSGSTTLQTAMTMLNMKVEESSMHIAERLCIF